MIHIMFTNSDEARKELQDRSICNLYTEKRGIFREQKLETLNIEDGEYIHAWCKEKGE